MIAQGSPEWFAQRLGKITASCFDKVLAKGRGNEPSVTRTDYMMMLLCERLTGVPAKSYENDAMRWGTEQEPYARLAFEGRHEKIAYEAEFALHPNMPYVGCSPDGRIAGEEALLEIKSPYKTAVHLDTLLSARMPTEHIPQIQGQMWVTGAQEVYFVSFDPRLPERHQLFVEKIGRDELYINKLALAVALFESELNDLIVRLDSLEAIPA